MRKLVPGVLALVITLTAQAQQIRGNYRVDGITHIATEAESVAFGSIPGHVRVERVNFKDGSSLYLLHLTVEPVKKASTAAPKGAKMTLTLSDGKLVRLEQMGQYPASAKYTQLKYAVEPADFEKLSGGIRAVDIITGWEPEDFIQASFAADELGGLLRRHAEAIDRAAGQTVEIQATLAERQETSTSVLTTTNPLVGRGTRFDYNILLSHLFYKNTGGEDFDLYFAIGIQEQFHIPFDSSVRFQLSDGSTIGLLQARDDVNFVLVYPSLEDVRRMVEVGITGLTIDCEDSTLEDRFVPREDGEYTFSGALAQELQLIFYVSTL